MPELCRRRGAGGQLAAVSHLPAVSKVAAAHAINPMTVSKAYSQLEAEGVLERQRGKGMAVAARASPGDAAAQRWALLDPSMDAVARQARELELASDEVLARPDQPMRPQ